MVSRAVNKKLIKNINKTHPVCAENTQITVEEFRRRYNSMNQYESDDGAKIVQSGAKYQGGGSRAVGI